LGRGPNDIPDQSEDGTRGEKPPSTELSRENNNIRISMVASVRLGTTLTISLNLPTHKNPTAKPACHDNASHDAAGLGPSSAMMREMVFAGSTHPRYP
jgi:hypothetical protein